MKTSLLKFAPLVLLALGPLGACDDVIRVRNLAPEANVLGLCAAADRVYIEIQVQDFEEDDVDVAVVIANKPALIGPTGDGLFGLRTDRSFPGNHHFLEWASEPCEAGEHCPSATCLDLDRGDLPVSECVALLEGSGTVGLEVLATDGDDVSAPAKATATVAAETMPPCDFGHAAHE